MEIATQPHEPPLILLSGMRADERLFRYQKEAFPNLIVPSWIEPDPKERLSDYTEHLARNANFLRWATLAVMAWKPQRSGTTPVCHIRGELDRTLPVRLTTPDVIVRGGDHLLPFTFPEQVNAFLRERMRSCMLRQRCRS